MCLPRFPPELRKVRRRSASRIWQVWAFLRFSILCAIFELNKCLKQKIKYGNWGKVSRKFTHSNVVRQIEIVYNILQKFSRRYPQSDVVRLAENFRNLKKSSTDSVRASVCFLMSGTWSTERKAFRVCLIWVSHGKFLSWKILECVVVIIKRYV